jgi:hypothetical protein
MVCRRSGRMVSLMVALTAACSAAHRPATEQDRGADAGTARDAATREASAIDAASAPMPDAAATKPRCSDLAVVRGPRFIVVAGTKLLTDGNSSFGSTSAVDETWVHGMVTEAGSGVPSGLDPTVASMVADPEGWRFARISNDAGDPWTILVQHLAEDLPFVLGSFAVTSKEWFDVRLRYGQYAFAPMVLELTILEGTTPRFYYGNAAQLSQLAPPPSWSITLGKVACVEPSDCFTTLRRHAVRFELPDSLTGAILNLTILPGENGELGGYVLKRYDAVSGESSGRCPDAVADHVELAVGDFL